MADQESKVLQGANRETLEAALPEYIRGRRWFGGKARRIRSVKLGEVMPLVSETAVAYIALAQVNYEEGPSQEYVLPLGVSAEGGEHGGPIAKLETTNPSGATVDVTVYDATSDPQFSRGLLGAISKGQTIESGEGSIVAWHTPAFERLDAAPDELEPSVMGAEQSNTSIRYGNRLILKLFRRLEEGTSPELEFGRFLSEKGFANTPPLVGAIEYRRRGGEPLTLAILQGFAPNQGDAWSYTLRTLEDYFERAMAMPESSEAPLPGARHPLDLVETAIPAEMQSLAGDYLASARLLGERTAQLHLALGEGGNDQSFSPESYTQDYQQYISKAMNGTTRQGLGLLRGRLNELPDATRREAETLLAKEKDIDAAFEPFRSRDISALRTRVHGDYHLGQVLYTGSDFQLIDFEGEPVRSLAERRQKHSPLKDVAGMLRSFHYAAYSGMFAYIEKHNVTDEKTLSRLEEWAKAWRTWVSAAYLSSYLQTVQDAHIVPKNQDDLRTVLDAHLLEKAVYELVYELNNRPDWVRIPLSGIVQLVG